MKFAVFINPILPFFTPRPSNFPSALRTCEVIRCQESSLFYPSFKSDSLLNPFRATMAVKNSTLTSQTSVTVKDRIDLTDKEKRIFDRLLQVLRHFNLQTQLRVAGGWVRDKLLGKECYDIDIALDNMLGKEFCEKVNEYLLSAGEKPEGIGVIQCNPEQSKHLETARMRIFDVWIDFVNLRAEDYAENSRIPTMRFGTAKEDAYRRDLTINSLFYNINSNLVEDFTGRGIADLKSGKIVTPLPAKQTFLDDPLRVLRAIRFGARFCFELDEELKKSASDEDVRAAIAEKISRERVGHEINLIISGNQPVKAMSYICDLQLFWVVFTLPPEFEPSIPDECDRLCVAYIDYAWTLSQMIRHSFTVEQRRLCLYAAFFIPFRETVYRDRKGRKIPAVNHIVRDSLKLKASDAERVVSLHIAAQKFMSLIPFFVDKEHIENIEVDWKKEIIDVPVPSKLRTLSGSSSWMKALLLRCTCWVYGLLLQEIKEFWNAALLLSILLYPTDIGCKPSKSSVQSELEKRIELYKTIENAIHKQGLEKVWEVKPLLNGKEIMSILNFKTGGPLIKQWQEKLLEWQLAHPSGTAEESSDWMREANSKRAKME